jgi:nitroimidazol reductase NimA-like FMN-containing flavoprotein (pyridoxamine 5'-phosphate oxidase superfamily)
MRRVESFDQTALNRVTRLPKRGAYDRETVYAIVDASPICHVGFVGDGQPFVIPTIHARVGDTLYFHGSAASRMQRHLGAGAPLCVTVTHLDGIVLARSVFHHSMNYRSAVLFGHGEMLTDPDERMAALRAVSEHLLPGRWDDSRGPNSQELKATSIVRMAIESASAKVQADGPSDEAEDYALPVWAGVLPIEHRWGAPVPDVVLREGIALPGYFPAVGSDASGKG